jgi:hypothetical protein
MSYQSNTLELQEDNRYSYNSEPAYLTLCDLIETVNSMAKDDELTAKIVAHMLNSGKVKLIGSFKGKKLAFV